MITQQDVNAGLVSSSFDAFFRSDVVVRKTSVYLFDYVANAIGFGKNSYHQKLMI